MHGVFYWLPLPQPGLPQPIGNFYSKAGRSQRGRNEHREVAGLRLGWLRPARFCEPQELGLILGPVSAPCGSAVAPPQPRAGGNLIQTRTTRLNDFLLQQSRAVNSTVARWDFISILLSAKREKSLFYAGGRCMPHSHGLCRPNSSHRSLFARRGASFSFDLSPKELNRLFRRQRAMGLRVLFFL